MVFLYTRNSGTMTFEPLFSQQWIGRKSSFTCTTRIPHSHRGSVSLVFPGYLLIFLCTEPIIDAHYIWYLASFSSIYISLLCSNICQLFYHVFIQLHQEYYFATLPLFPLSSIFSINSSTFLIPANASHDNSPSSNHHVHHKTTNSDVSLSLQYLQHTPSVFPIRLWYALNQSCHLKTGWRICRYNLSTTHRNISALSLIFLTCSPKLKVKYRSIWPFLVELSRLTPAWHWSTYPSVTLIKGNHLSLFANLLLLAIVH